MWLFQSQKQHYHNVLYICPCSFTSTCWQIRKSESMCWQFSKSGNSCFCFTNCWHLFTHSTQLRTSYHKIQNNQMSGPYFATVSTLNLVATLLSYCTCHFYVDYFSTSKNNFWYLRILKGILLTFCNLQGGFALCIYDFINSTTAAWTKVTIVAIWPTFTVSQSMEYSRHGQLSRCCFRVWTILAGSHDMIPLSFLKLLR